MLGNKKESVEEEEDEVLEFMYSPRSRSRKSTSCQLKRFQNQVLYKSCAALNERNTNSQPGSHPVSQPVTTIELRKKPAKN